MDYSLNSDNQLGRQLIFNSNKIAALLTSKILLYIIVAILVVRIILVLVSLPLPPNIFFADITKIDLLNLLNSNRQKLGLNTLSENSELDNAAYLKAQDMIKKGYFAHQSPEGITPWYWFSQAGYSYKYAGENLAIGFTDSNNVYEAWVNSPSHKENLFSSKYREVGTAVLRGFGDNGAIVIVQFFGSPIANSTSPSVADINKNISPSSKASTKTPNEIPSEIATENSLFKQVPQENETSSTISVGRVLAESTIYSIFSSPNNNAKNSLYLVFLNFIVYSNDNILQFAAYFLLLVIAGLLIIFAVYLKQGHKGVLLRSFSLIAMLLISIVLQGDALSKIIPYNTYVN